MNFNSALKLLTEVSYMSYSIPSDKQELMMDFYMINFLFNNIYSPAFEDFSKIQAKFVSWENKIKDEVKGGSTPEEAMKKYPPPEVPDIPVKKKLSRPWQIGFTTDPDIVKDTFGGKPDLDTKFQESLDDARDKIYNHLIEEMKDSIFFAMCCEFMHIYDANSAEKLNNFFKKHDAEKFYYKITMQYAVKKSEMKKYVNFEPTDQTVKMARLINESEKDYVKRYDSVMAGIKELDSDIEKAKLRFSEIAAVAFHPELSWSGMYGGTPWKMIAKAYPLVLKAYKSKDIKEMMIAIDTSYSLEHNTNTMFNKIKKYSKEGSYGWVKKALDMKKLTASPWIIWNFASSDMQKIAARALHFRGYGSSEELHNYVDYIKNTGLVRSVPKSDLLGDPLSQNIVSAPKPAAPTSITPSASTGTSSVSFQQLFLKLARYVNKSDLAKFKTAFETGDAKSVLPEKEKMTLMKSIIKAGQMDILKYLVQLNFITDEQKTALTTYAKDKGYELPSSVFESPAAPKAADSNISYAKVFLGLMRKIENLNDFKELYSTSNAKTILPLSEKLKILKAAIKFNKPDIVQFLVSDNFVQPSDLTALNTYIQQSASPAIKDIFHNLIQHKTTEKPAVKEEPPEPEAKEEPSKTQSGDEKIVIPSRNTLEPSMTDSPLDTNKKLIYAVIKNDYDLVKKLLDFGADAKFKKSKALQYASQNSKIDTKIIKALINAGSDVSTRNNFVIDNAALRGNDEVVKMLLKAGAKPTWQTFRNAIKSENIKMISYLSSEVDINEKDYLGMTHMETAIETHNPKIVKELIKLGATVTKENLKHAVYFGDSDIIDIIQSELPQTSTTTTKSVSTTQEEPKKTPTAKKEDDLNEQLENALNKNEIADAIQLIVNGANIHIANDYPLAVAAIENSTELLNTLISKGVDVTVDNNHAIVLAAKFGSNRVIPILISNGADIHAKDDYPIKQAIQNDKADTVKLLVSAGVVPTNELVKLALDNDSMKVYNVLRELVPSDKIKTKEPRVAPRELTDDEIAELEKER